MIRRKFGLYYPNPNVAFNPLSLITGGGGFWRADMGTSVNGGTSQLTWSDQSSFNNALVSGAGSSAMVPGSTSFNSSYHGISQTAGNQGTNNTTMTFASTSTLSAFALVETSSPPDENYGRLVSFTKASPSGADYNSAGCFEMDDGNSSTPKIGGSSNSTGPTQATVTAAVPVLAGLVFTGSDMQLWINGSMNNQVSYTANIGGAGNNSFGIGGDANNPTSDIFRGVFAFVGLTQRAMNSTDWTNLKNWSNSNWGTSF